MSGVLENSMKYVIMCSTATEHRHSHATAWSSFLFRSWSCQFIAKDQTSPAATAERGGRQSAAIEPHSITARRQLPPVPPLPATMSLLDWCLGMVPVGSFYFFTVIDLIIIAPNLLTLGTTWNLFPGEFVSLCFKDHCLYRSDRFRCSIV